MVFLFALGWNGLPVETRIAPTHLQEAWGGHFDVNRDHGQETDVETSVGIGGASRDRKRHCPEEGLFCPLLSSFRPSGWLPPPGWCELEGESFVNEVKNKATHFVRWSGLNFQISDFMKSDSKINLVFDWATPKQLAKKQKVRLVWLSNVKEPNWIAFPRKYLNWATQQFRYCVHIRLKSCLATKNMLKYKRS